MVLESVRNFQDSSSAALSLYQTTIHTKPCRLVNAACSYPARDFITKDERPLYSRQSTQIRIKNLYTTLDYCCYGATVRPIPSHPGFVGPPPVDCYC